MNSFQFWQQPPCIEPSRDFEVSVEGSNVPVYRVRVRSEILTKPGLWSHRPNAPAESASFAILDLAKPARISVRPSRPFSSAAVLPKNAGVQCEVCDGAIVFAISRPCHLTVALDGSDKNPLHLLVSTPLPTDELKASPQVIRIGPGAHDTGGIKLSSGQTLVIEGGAVLRAVTPPEDKGSYSEQWHVTFHGGTVIEIRNAENVRVVGRGIITAAGIPHPGWNMIRIEDSRNVTVEGITLLDAANWNVMVNNSENVNIEDLRIISARLNTDGINSVNSRSVSIRRCFVRNHDDGIVVKTIAPARPAADITVRDCTLWADWGYGLGVTYETRSDVRNVIFERCNMIFARHSNLGIHVSDSGSISNVVFRDIEIDDLGWTGRTNDARDALGTEPMLFRGVITSDVWGHDAECGRISDVAIENIAIMGGRVLPSLLSGFDESHMIRRVLFRNISLADRGFLADASILRLTAEKFVDDIRVESAKDTAAGPVR